MATFKIGNDLFSLIDLPKPSRSSGLGFNYKYNYTVKESIFGQRNVTYSGRVKRDIRLEFEHKTVTEFNTILAYCNTPFSFWLEVKSDANQIVFQNKALLFLEDVKIETTSDDFKHFFKVKILEV